MTPHFPDFVYLTTVMAHKYDAEGMIGAELNRIRPIYHDKEALKAFWEERYRQTYALLLADRSEYGRYGVVAEYLLRTVSGGSVLDVGCGPGLLAGLLPRNSISYTGLDITEKAIAMAQQHFPDLKERFHRTDLAHFRSPERFDAITAVEVLYYLDAEGFFAHCARLLKPGGHLVITVYDFEKGRELLPIVADRLEDPFRAEVYNAEKELRWHVLGGVFRKR